MYLQFICVSGRQHDCGITNPKRHLKVALLKEKDLRLIPKSTQVVYQSKFWVKLLWVQIVKCVCGVEQWLQSLTHYPCIVAEYGLMPDRKKQTVRWWGKVCSHVCVCVFPDTLSCLEINSPLPYSCGLKVCMKTQEKGNSSSEKLTNWGGSGVEALI